MTSNHADPGQIFRPESNRLCKFFEISSLTLSLAPRGGFQGKAGFVRLPGSNTSRRSNQPGMSPLSWFTDRSPKWFTIRDSYFVATDGPEAVGLLFSPNYIHLSPSSSYLFISMRPFADQCLCESPQIPLPLRNSLSTPLYPQSGITHRVIDADTLGRPSSTKSLCSTKISQSSDLNEPTVPGST